jgi:hypothetical protein
MNLNCCIVASKKIVRKKLTILIYLKRLRVIPTAMSLILSFDIGYASIGWYVLSAKEKLPDILGTSVVTFPTDDCLASTRRDLRRTRRHIRSTRQRIERLKRWLIHRGILTREDLDKPGHPAPFLLAAAALQSHHTLSAWELWTVLRWYAHNRGYDGNSRWANDHEDTEDTEKVLQANRLMDEHGTETMCETVCKSWELTGTLAVACPEIVDAAGKVRHKDEIRGLTHLHHALDAATLALAAYYFSLRHYGQNQAGKIWQALMKRRRSDDEKKFLHSLGIFDTYSRPRRDGQGNETDVRLRDLPAEVKNALARSLAECRVMQHIPADRSGTKAELTTWSIVCHDGENTILVQRPNRSTFKRASNGGEQRWENQELKKEAAKLLEKYRDKLTSRQQNLVIRGLLKLTSERTSKLLGPFPTASISKLQPHGMARGTQVIGENFAIALDPSPCLIPFHKVNSSLASLTLENGGKAPRLLRNGTLINVLTGTWAGQWRILSVKNSEAYGISVDLTNRYGVKLTKGNAKVLNMLEDGLEILPRRYTGHPIKH